MRMKQRGYELLYIRRQVATTPYNVGFHRWKIPGTRDVIVFYDYDCERYVITVHPPDKEDLEVIKPYEGLRLVSAEECYRDG